MFADNRQNIIYDMIKKNGAVSTAELVEQFGVSIETVRRDLLSMEKKNILKRVHGGAVKTGEMMHFHTLVKRNEENYELKKKLAVKAVSEVRENDIIAIDSGSTATIFAEELKKRFSKLTVVTHSLDVFEILCRHADFDVILCSGYFKREENTFYGYQVIESLKKLHVDKVFIFPTAISLTHGICDFDKELLDVQRTLLGTGNKIYVLADSSKFEMTALLKMDDMKREYVYVTDDGLADSLKNLYRDNEIKILEGTK